MTTKTKIPNNAKSGTGTSYKLNTSKSCPSNVQIDDNTYYLYRGESIKVDGHPYFAHLTNINYWIGQHDLAGMEYTLVACSANSGIWKLVVNGSNNFVDVSGLAR
jgi:hypothetical protein